MKLYVAFFDLDYTILDISTARFFARYLYHRNIIGRNEFFNNIFTEFIHRTGLMSPESIINRWAKRYSGVSERRAIYFLQLCFDHIVVNHFRKSILDEIDFHKKNKGCVVILSASTIYVCNPVKEYLQLDDVICSELEVIDGHFTGRLLGKYCYGREKLNRALEYCHSNHYRIEDAYYYADSYDDIHLFEKVKNPVCVSPDRKLKRVATERGWDIITA